MIAKAPEDPGLFEPEIIPARRGFSVRYKNKTLLSSIDPAGQAEKASAAAVQQERTLYFCPSPLFGYGLELFLSKLKGDSALLCAETDEKLLALSLSSIESGIVKHPRFMLSGVSDPAGLCGLVRQRWGSRSFRRVISLKLNPAWQLDAEKYGALEDALRKNIAQEWGNAMTLVKLGRRFARNAIRNLAPLSRAPPLSELSFGSKPVLVLGAGPSADPFLDLLQQRGFFNAASGRPETFVLVCVDTCLPALLERGLRPDLAVVLESQFWNLRDFSGARNTGIALALDFSAYPAAAKITGGPEFFFFTPWTPLRLFERLEEAGLLPPVLPPLGSVGLSAVELARRLSGGPLIAAGLDFSFSQYATHTRSSPWHLSVLGSHNRLSGLWSAAAFQPGVSKALSKSNIQVKTNPALRGYRDLFEEEFSSDPRIRDIEGSGLPLGLQTLSLEEAAFLLSAKGGESGPEKAVPARTAAGPVPGRACFAEFCLREKALLEELRRRLSGGETHAAEKANVEKTAAGECPAGETQTGERLKSLLDSLDYLWAHFPDCAAAGGRRPDASDLGFLKRVRAEIDPFIKLWKLDGDELTSS